MTNCDVPVCAVAAPEVEPPDGRSADNSMSVRLASSAAIAESNPAMPVSSGLPVFSEPRTRVETRLAQPDHLFENSHRPVHREQRGQTRETGGAEVANGGVVGKNPAHQLELAGPRGVVQFRAGVDFSQAVD